MTNGIAVLYDLRTPESIDYSMNIITTLASRGIGFDISQNSERGVVLIVNGTIYTPEQIERHEKEVLGYVYKIDKMNRRKVVRVRESELAKM